MSIVSTAGMTGTPIDHTALDPRYSITEAAKLELDTLFEAMQTVTLLAEIPDEKRSDDLETAHFAAVYRAMSFLGKRVMADARIEFPAGLVKAAS